MAVTRRLVGSSVNTDVNVTVPSDAVQVTGVSLFTVLVGTVMLAEEEPAGMATEAGRGNARLLAVTRVIILPPVGAATLRAILTVIAVPPAHCAGESEKTVKPDGTTVTVPTDIVPARLTVICATCVDVTAFVVTVNGKLSAFAVRFNVPGTITAELSLVRVAVSIIVISQGASKFMLPAVLCPPTIVGGAKVTSLTSCALARVGNMRAVDKRNTATTIESNL